MYRIPKELNLSKAIGQPATQIHVGQFDLQVSFGGIHFAIWSPIKLVRDGKVIGIWEEDRWPDPQFKEILNVNIQKYEIPNERAIILYFENGIEMHLIDHSDQYESMSISVDGESGPWII
jgi:hypothetical protein